MKLNLGCGPDVRSGYLNVDLRKMSSSENFLVCNLSKLPWPWQDSSIKEILMLDFLEHFSYHLTNSILLECWRILEPDGEVVIQVPDFEECANLILKCTHFCARRHELEYNCNNATKHCGKCRNDGRDIATAAMHRLYGGQDYEGNWHYTAFTISSLKETLFSNGFYDMKLEEVEHQTKNWNFKIRAKKCPDLWK
jgi:predicted SAM-dependent methyltransferase